MQIKLPFRQYKELKLSSSTCISLLLFFFIEIACFDFMIFILGCKMYVCIGCACIHACACACIHACVCMVV